MEEGVCYIVGAGECDGLAFVPGPGDAVIAADAGFAHLQRHHIAADLVIGDFDALGYVPEHPNVRVLPSEKEDTDALAAARAGIQMGYRTFHLYCCTGGRPDHTIANIQLLAYLAQGGRRGFLYDRDCIITALADGGMAFGPRCRGTVSIFSYSEQSLGVCLKGLKYELEDARLTHTFPRGISNEFTGKPSAISVAKGTLLVFFPRGAMEEIQ